jgi:sortase A
MKRDPATTSVKKTLVVLQYVLLVLGILALSYFSTALIEARTYQKSALQQLTAERSAARGPAKTASPASGRSAENAGTGSGGSLPFGQLEIPRIHLSAMVAEGSSPGVLRRALGHIPGTALPGQAGNMAIAGHRDTFFRHLGRLQPGDVIELNTAHGRYQYAVKFTEIVGPEDTQVLRPGSGKSLTLVTCYPFYYVGPAPRRFIVRAVTLGAPEQEIE